MADPDPIQPAGSPLWLRIVLIGSLAMNLVIVGVVAGAILSPDGPRAQRAAADQRLGALPFVMALEPKDRRDLARSLRDGPRAQMAAMPGPRERMRTILDAIRAEPFDPDRLAGLLAEQREAGLTRQIRGEAALIEKLSGMTPEERERYADRVIEALSRRPSTRKN